MLAAAVPHVASRRSAHRRRPLHPTSLVAVLTALVGVLAVTVPAAAVDGGCWETGRRCDTVNAYRADHGQPALDQTAALQTTAGAWARRMAATGVLEHSPAAGTAYAEVVGVEPDWQTAMVAWDESPRHREILLGPGQRVGIGRAVDADGHGWFVVQVR